MRATQTQAAKSKKMITFIFNSIPPRKIITPHVICPLKRIYSQSDKICLCADKSARRGISVCVCVRVNGDRSLRIPRPLSVSTNHKAASAMWFNEPSCVRAWGLHLSRIKEEQKQNHVSSRNATASHFELYRNSKTFPSSVLFFFSPRSSGTWGELLASSSFPMMPSIMLKRQSACSWQKICGLIVRSCIAVALYSSCAAVTEIILNY